MTWKCAIENDKLGYGVKVALADTREHGNTLLHFAPVAQSEYDTATQIPDDAWLRLPRDAAIALMLELQQKLAPDRRLVDREVLERCDEALAIERARVDLILDRDSRAVIVDATGAQQ